MKLNDFKMGEVIYRPMERLETESRREAVKHLPRSEHTFWFIQFLAFEKGILFCSRGHMPSKFIDYREFQSEMTDVEGQEVYILADPPLEGWERFPIQVLKKVKAFLKLKQDVSGTNSASDQVAEHISPSPTGQTGGGPIKMC